jgi:C-terminal processing protease CtpA/Prc
LPNKYFNEGFDYTYTGLGIYSIDGKIIIVDVIEGSPADKAGLKMDDQVFSVENNLSGDIQQYKNLLQVPNKKLKIIISRDGNLMELYLQTKSIL